MKISLIASALIVMGSCANLSHNQELKNLKDSIVFEDAATVLQISKSITPETLKSHVYTLSASDFEGRATGKPGFDKASTYVKNFYQQHNIPSPLPTGEYFQSIPESYFSEKSFDSQNVIAYVEGSEHPEEVIILSAHLDHLGRSQEVIYYGADDNASGTAAVMEMAKAFALAQKKGVGPKRSILFLHLTAEEIGLFGSQYYADHPVFTIENTVANLNIDMIGRVDRRYASKQVQDYIYLIGADRLSTKLHYISETANDRFTNLTLDYTYNKEDDPNRYYYRSDHYTFASRNIPVIFYFSGGHEDYHQPTDTPDKINYSLLQQRTQLIFSTAWYLANAEERLSADTL